MSGNLHGEMASEAEVLPGETGVVKVIKRYANRKLYDTSSSRYITLDEIREMVMGGVDVRIIDNRTKEDLTSATLAQILFAGEKRDGRMSLGVLHRMIRGSGSAVQEFLSEKVTPQVGWLRDEAGTRVGRLFRREEAVGAPNAQVRELFASSQRTLEEWQRRVDDRVRGGMDAFSGLPQLQKDLTRMHERLDALEKKLALLDVR